MAGKVKATVNKAAGNVHETTQTIGWLAGGVALVAFGLGFVADVVEALTESDDVIEVPVIDEAE